MTQTRVSIRAEQDEDHAAISDLTQRAFAPMPYASGTEQDIIEALREKGALSLSLVAIRDGELVGHVAFSPAETSASSSPWFALGPIAVEPSLQRQGVGSLLIREGIRWLRSKDAAGCILVGDLSYYSKFDFEARPELAPHGEPPEFFMVLPLRVAEPLSVITFHPLFREDQLRLLRPIA